MPLPQQPYPPQGQPPQAPPPAAPPAAAPPVAPPAAPADPNGLAPTGQPDDQGGGGDTENASPEEQAAYEKLINNCFAVIYDPGTIESVLKTLKASQDFKQNLAYLSGTILAHVVSDGMKKGVQIPDASIMEAGQDLIADLAVLSERAGIHKFSQDEFEGALYAATDIYRKTMEGTGQLDPTQANQDMRTLVEANNTPGGLDKVLPGATEMASKFAKEQGQQGKPAPTQLQQKQRGMAPSAGPIQPPQGG